MKVTLFELRALADRLYGSDLISVLDGKGRLDGPALTVFVRGGKRIVFEGKSKQAARKLAFETLRRMGAAE